VAKAKYTLSQDKFYYLLDDVIAQGGIHEPAYCAPTPIDYSERTGGKATTHGCRKQFRVGIPYEGIEQKNGRLVAHEGMATVCAEADGIEWWPRFQPEAM
jgi:hypothetical protein